MGQLGLVVPRHLLGRRARRVLSRCPERDGGDHGRGARRRRRSQPPVRDRRGIGRRDRGRQHLLRARELARRAHGEERLQGREEPQGVSLGRASARGAGDVSDRDRAVHPRRTDGDDVRSGLHQVVPVPAVPPGGHPRGCHLGDLHRVSRLLRWQDVRGAALEGPPARLRDRDRGRRSASSSSGTGVRAGAAGMCRTPPPTPTIPPRVPSPRCSARRGRARGARA